MCGRFTHRFTWKQLHALLSGRLKGVAMPEGFAGTPLLPSFNVAPTQIAPVLRLKRAEGDAPLPAASTGAAPTRSPAPPRAASPALEGVMLRWGLVPSWAKDLSIGSRAINARCEGLEARPMFRSALASRRCVVPASGFYEWPKDEHGRKQPLYITRADGEPLLFAGLWEWWRERGPDDSPAPAPVETFTIITEPAQGAMTALHDRTPAILEPEEVEPWLAAPGAKDAHALLPPVPDGVLRWHPVSPRVNSPRNNDEGLIEAVTAPTSEARQDTTPYRPSAPPEAPAQRGLFDP